MRLPVSAAVLLFALAGPAIADLYRWVDPATGSIKYSSYPPPWFGDAAKQPRAPKVEVIPTGKEASAFEAAPGPDREPAADVPRGDRRGALLKLVAQRIRAMITSPLEGTEQAFTALSESLQELEQLDRQSKSSISANPKEESARLEEKYQLAAPLEAHRLVLTQQISAYPPPPPASAALDAVANAWRGLQQRLSALERTNEAITALDTRKVNARHFEMRALAEKVYAVWEPSIETALGRR